MAVYPLARVATTRRRDVATVERFATSRRSEVREILHCLRETLREAAFAGVLVRLVVGIRTTGGMRNCGPPTSGRLCEKSKGH